MPTSALVLQSLAIILVITGATLAAPDMPLLVQLVNNLCIAANGFLLGVYCHQQAA